MKLKQVGALCVASRSICIFNEKEGKTQWVSDGVGTYSLLGLPKLTPEAAAIIFDVTPDKLRTFGLKEDNLPDMISGVDVYEDEDLEQLTISITDKDREIFFFKGMQTSKIYLFDAAYFKPLADEPSEYMGFRILSTKSPILQVKCGFDVKAYICGINPGIDFARRLQNLGESLIEKLLLDKDENAKASEQDTDELQTKLNCEADAEKEGDENDEE